MIDTLKIFDELKETMDPSAAKKIAEILGAIHEEVVNTVTKEEFKELKYIVAELAEAQKRTEQRVEELAEAQKRTEQRVEELAEAQKRTEQEVRKLAESLEDTRKMVGGLSDTVGYGLEDKAIKYLPELLKDKYQIIIENSLVRKFVKYNGIKDEINIYGTGKKNGEEISIIGEAKSQLSRKDIDKFIKLINRLEINNIISKNKFLLVVTYSAEPEIEEYAKTKNIKVIWSYQVQ
ncbi:MAG: chordopoxvirus fusion protein [Candidatus Omnitrophica bacterium]|nr:chordopoxvirus fusion protein [Candidatus Omnitrophota bacterium]